MKKFETLEDLPTDHFKMPPPYWRSSGTIFHIIDALEDLCKLLNELIKMNDIMKKMFFNWILIIYLQIHFVAGILILFFYNYC